MFSWIWGCMILSVKVLLGGFFWIVAFWLFAIAVAGIAFATQKKTPEKPKYKGEPIVIKGGKDAK